MSCPLKDSCYFYPVSGIAGCRYRCNIGDFDIILTVVVVVTAVADTTVKDQV